MVPVVQQSPLPSRHAIRSLLSDLTGRDVDLKDSEPVPAKSTNVVAVYVTDRLAVSAVAVLNLEGAARLGAALGMLPRAAVEDAIKDRELPEHMRDCCYEVLNVMASVFNVGEVPHVRLYEMYGPGGGLPPDIAALAAMAGSRMDVTLSISGFGLAGLSIVIR